MYLYDIVADLIANLSSLIVYLRGIADLSLYTILQGRFKTASSYPTNYFAGEQECVVVVVVVAALHSLEPIHPP